MGVCLESRGQQMLVQPQLGHIELAQVCSRFVFDETFEPRLIFVGFTRHTKEMCKYPRLVVGDFQ